MVLYRSSASTLALTGNLVVSGQITGTGAPLSLSSNNIWTGTNQFTQPVQFSNTVSVPDTGLTFTAPGAAVTRTALGLVPGTNLQAYDADLQTLAGLPKQDGNLIVADGTTWTVESGATLRATLGLGTASNVTFNQLTSTTSIVAATGSLSGQLSLPGATQSAGALLLGTTTELYESPAGTLRTPDNLRVDGTTQLGTDGTTPTTVTGQLRLGSGDVTLERSDAGELTLDGDLGLTGNLDLGGTLGVGSGGTGLDLSGMAANRFLYTSGVGVLDTSPVTAAGRALLDDPDTPTMLTTLGAQAADTDLTALGGLAKTKGNLIGANGTTWLTVPVGADGQYLIADSSQAAGWRWGAASFSLTDTTFGGTLDAGGATSFELPNSTTPTTDGAGELAFDTNAWLTGRGAWQYTDGTSQMRLVGVQATDTPAVGQVPTWGGDGVLTWEYPSLDDPVLTGVVDAGGADSIYRPKAWNYTSLPHPITGAIH